MWLISDDKTRRIPPQFSTFLNREVYQRRQNEAHTTPIFYLFKSCGLSVATKRNMFSAPICYLFEEKTSNLNIKIWCNAVLIPYPFTPNYLPFSRPNYLLFIPQNSTFFAPNYLLFIPQNSTFFAPIIYLFKTIKH